MKKTALEALEDLMVNEHDITFSQYVKDKQYKVVKEFIEQALQPTNIDNEVIQFVELNVEQALNDLFAYEKGNKEKYYGVWNFLGDLQSITNKALTTPSKSAKEITDKEYELILEYRKILKLQDIRDNNYVSTAIQKLKELEEK